MQDLFVFEPQVRSRGKVEGRFRATGIVPRFVDEARTMGVDVDPGLFEEGQGA